MKKKKTVVILIVAALLIAGSGAGYLYYKSQIKLEAVPEETINTTTVRSGELIISATGAGAVISQSDIEVGFSTSGTLEEIYVAVGDQVTTGQQLAKLASDPQLELDLASDQISVINAQKALDDLYTNLESDLADATIQYLTTKSELADLEVDRAALNYKRCVDTTIENLEANYYEARDSYNRKVDLYNTKYIGRDPEDLEKQKLEASIANDKVSMDTAWANWQYCLQTPSDDEKELADANILVKEAEINSWKQTKDTLKNGPDPDELALLEAELTQAKAKLMISQNNIDGLILTAPVSGTVMSINGIIGESIGTSSFIRLADLSKPIVEVYLDENDLENIAVGFEVDVIFDAFEEQTFVGKVISVSPELVSSGNVKYVYGLVELDPTSFGKPFNLPIGLNASVEVIGGKAENALLIPVEALKSMGDGEYAVFVMENGVPKLRLVEVGLMDFTYAEIKSGLSLGDLVTTGIVETIQ
jgi:multidrug efflux pump subunit AcrA (membrane-fusion protein)